MKKMLMACLSVAALALPMVGQADDDFYGKIESRPDAKVGEWVIGGKTVNATAQTELDDRKGPLTVGSCVEVEIDDGAFEEIEAEKMRKCDRQR
jgi:hypothetical protein